MKEVRMECLWIPYVVSHWHPRRRCSSPMHTHVHVKPRTRHSVWAGRVHPRGRSVVSVILRGRARIRANRARPCRQSASARTYSHPRGRDVASMWIGCVCADARLCLRGRWFFIPWVTQNGRYNASKSRTTPHPSFNHLSVRPSVCYRPHDDPVFQ